MEENVWSTLYYMDAMSENIGCLQLQWDYSI